MTYEVNNCEIIDGRVIISGNINNTDTYATIIVHGGLMDGTTCTIKPDENIIVRYELSEDNLGLYLKTYKVNDESNEEEISGVTLRYSLNNSEVYAEYANKILLKAGTNTIKVKFFDTTVLDEEISTSIPLILNAIRKNGKIYILSNADIKYSFEQDGTYNTYTSPIQDDENHEKIYVKINGSEEITELIIKNSNVQSESEYNIFDTKTGYNNAFYNNIIERKNGKLKIADIDMLQYSYDEYNWYDFENRDIDDLGTEKLYIKKRYGSNETETLTYYINDENKLSQIFGSYNQNMKNYIFSQVRENSKQTDNRILLMNDENKIDTYNKNIIDTTDFYGNVLILTDEEKVYRVTDNYEIVEVSGGTNIKQIEGIYAINNDNEILKCTYTGSGISTIEYNVCGEYSFDKTI